MPSKTVDIGYGTVVTFGVSGYSGEIFDVRIQGVTRNSIDTTHMATPLAGPGNFGSKTFIPSKLVDPGTLVLQIHWNPDNIPPIEGSKETITITWSEGATYAGEGFVVSFDVTAPLEDKMVATTTVKASGSWTHTPAT